MKKLTIILFTALSFFAKGQEKSGHAALTDLQKMLRLNDLRTLSMKITVLSINCLYSYEHEKLRNSIAEFARHKRELNNDLDSGKILTNDSITVAFENIWSSAEKITALIKNDSAFNDANNPAGDYQRGLHILENAIFPSVHTINRISKKLFKASHHALMQKLESHPVHVQSACHSIQRILEAQQLNFDIFYNSFQWVFIPATNSRLKNQLLQVIPSSVETVCEELNKIQSRNAIENKTRLTAIGLFRDSSSRLAELFNLLSSEDDHEDPAKQLIAENEVATVLSEDHEKVHSCCMVILISKYIEIQNYCIAH